MKNSKEHGSKDITIDGKKLEKILEEILNGNAKTLNEYANEVAKELFEKRLTTSQIRHVLNEIQRMPKNQFNEMRLQLLRPKLAYAAGRHQSEGVKVFQKIVDMAIQMTNERNYQNFRYFIEAIVAYHRYYGGKEA